MSALLLAPVGLALLLLAAHFLRAGYLPLVGVPLALIALLAVRRPWIARLVQAVLLLGAAEWVRTLIVFASARARAGQPLLRLALILGGVAVVTAAAALVFRAPRIRRRYRLGVPPADNRRGTG